MSGGVWVPLGRSDWPHGWRLDASSATYPTGDSPFGMLGTETFDKSAQEDRRLISALFTLLEHDKPRHRRGAQAEPTGRAQRRAPQESRARGRSRSCTSDAPKVVRRPGEPTSEHHYSHRFPCVCSPKHAGLRSVATSLHRLIMVPAHVKGPQDAPFIAKYKRSRRGSDDGASLG